MSIFVYDLIVYFTERMYVHMNKILSFTKKIFWVILLGVFAFLLFKIAPYYKPTETFEKGVLRVVVDDKDVTNSLPDEVFVENDVVMMTSKTAMKYFDNIYIYYDEKYDTAIITSDKMIGKIKLGTNTINVNGEDKALEGTAFMSGEQLYIPISSVEEVTDVSIDFNEKVIATTPRGMSRVKIVKSGSKQKLKAYKNNISMSNGFAYEDELLYVFDTENKAFEDYLTVRNIRGDIGYMVYQEIDAKDILYFNQGTDIQIKEAVDDMKYVLAWEYAENYSPDRSNESKMKALDIISPTWLYLTDDEGNIKSTMDQEYFNWAKDEKYQVWPTLKNDFISMAELSTIMNDMELRNKLINNVLDYAIQNKLEGINIDFENMYKEDKNVFSQFVREFSSAFRRNGIIVSIDVTVPGGSDTYSLCYDRTALSKAVDYMMLMAYDQYGVWSTNAGPVASLSWVERNIIDMLGYEGVDKDKLFLCVPFYSRYWSVNTETGNVKSSKAIDMETANSYLERYKEYAKWSDEDGQYYIEFTQNDTTVKIWIENEEALKKKIELINKYDLAGVAVWRWGFEDDEAFKTIDETMNIQ